MIRRVITVISTSLIFLCAASAQGMYDKIILDINSRDGMFALGDSVIVTAHPQDGFSSPVRISTYVNGLLSEEKDYGVITDGDRIIAQSYNKPAGIRIEIRDTVGKDNKDKAVIGFIVGPEQFKPAFEAPKDLHRFWKRQLREMRKVPMDVKARPVPLNGEDSLLYEAFEVEISSIDSIPVRGYLTRPKDARVRSLPIVMYMHGAGVTGQWCRARVSTALSFTKMGGGAITLDFNAHGMLNDAPQSYYEELQNNLNDTYIHCHLRDHESFYFRTMFLRAVRALDYLCRDSLWDGKRVLVTGESQGGAQAAVVASLDRRVTHAMPIVPGFFGLGGILEGRKSAWPFLLERDGVDSPARTLAPYYDMVLLMQYSRAEWLIEIALNDTAASPQEILTGYNGYRGKKTLLSYPWRSHTTAGMNKRDLEGWNREIKSARDSWINKVLSGN